MWNSTQRFSTRVAHYVKYRPSYPPQVVDLLTDAFGLTVADVVVDVGSGTGLLTRLFLERGHRVIGVEPNRAMREAGEQVLRDCSRFESAAGTAEATSLPDRCAALVISGQAFHWFDRPGARSEFRRILAPPAGVALAWNDRRNDASPLMEDYEQLLHAFGTDYRRVSHNRIDDQAIGEFFEGPFQLRQFPNRQVLSWEGLQGRLVSSSYVPEAGEPGHEEMVAALRKLFDRHHRDGRVAFEYETRLYHGRLE